MPGNLSSWLPGTHNRSPTGSQVCQTVIKHIVAIFYLYPKEAICAENVKYVFTTLVLVANGTVNPFPGELFLRVGIEVSKFQKYSALGTIYNMIANKSEIKKMTTHLHFNHKNLIII